MSVNYFTNHDELEEKLRASIERNKERLFAPEPNAAALKAAE
jgi:hypothetical protein